MGGKKRVFSRKTVRHSHPVSKDKQTHSLAASRMHEHDLAKTHAAKPEHEGSKEYSPYQKRHFLKRLLKIYHEFPPGISMLLVFSSILGALYIVLASMFSFTIVAGMVIQGAFSRFLNIIMIIIIAFMIFGISKKRMWAYHLSLWVFSFVILNSVISMFLIKQNVSGILNVFVVLSFFFILMMNMITLWYIKSKKNYFLHPYHSSHMEKEDRTFIFALTGLWIAFILTSGVLGNEFYNQTTQKTDQLFSELQGVYPYSAEDYCLQKIDDRDLCLLTAAVMYEKVINSNILCNDIDSQFFKYTCFKAMKGDFV